MAEQDFEPRKTHLSLDRVRTEGAYAFPKLKITKNPARDDYVAHGMALLRQLAEALPGLPPAGADPRLSIQGLRPGVLVTVETQAPDTDRKGPSRIPVAFEIPGQDLVVLSARRTADRAEEAIVFVPDDARAGLAQRLRAYGADNLGNRDRPHVAQFEKVERIASADTANLFKAVSDFDDPAPRWWELWVRDVRDVPRGLIAAARAQRLDVHPEQLVFPDTTVVFVHATARQALAFASRVPGAIEEVRPGAGTIEHFLTLDEGRVTQHDFVADLAGRIIPPRTDAPTVCVLDTGVAGAHPLLSDGLAIAMAVDEAWGADDHERHDGHGTSVVSLALHGDLDHPMNDTRFIELTHSVESVKILPPRGFAATPPPSYGIVTQSAVSLVEASRPDRERSFCVASCYVDGDASRPSSWSGALDQIAAGELAADGVFATKASEKPKRVVLVAAGNVTGATAVKILDGAPINDPAQSWNALTIGGYTAKADLGPNAAGKAPIALANDLSPFSTTSHELPSDLLPLKPEVLFEAGNMAVDEQGYCDWHPAVSLLTAGKLVDTNPLAPFWATSAAVGMAGHFMGRLQAALPGYWPETYRALMVHSARWPQVIAKKLIPPKGKKWKADSKGDKIKLLRQVGFGVPQLDLAIASAKNDFTMIAQAEIQPYTEGATSAVYNEVHFYDLPWPRTTLAELGDKAVTLRVTLSYFVEPNLTGKGATRPETYRSFGLRFALKKRNETEETFHARLSRLRTDGEVEPDEDDWDAFADILGETAPTASAPEDEDKDDDKSGSNWLIGPKAVSAGSLHCDIWRGKAEDLVNHDAIAVHPAPGWWKSHTGQGRQSDRGRYALVLSISADGVDVDLYAEASAVLLEKETRIATSIG
jgi:hypothetical protein